MKKQKDSLGDRMKTYEAVPKVYLTLGTPKIIRLDMRAGHSFCKKFNRPFDDVFSECMIHTTKELCAQIAGVVMGYTQSDEISLVINDITEEGNINSFFDGGVEKMVSISASIATIAFNKKYMEVGKCIDEFEETIKQIIDWEPEFNQAIGLLIISLLMTIHSKDEIAGWENTQRVNYYIDDLYERYLRKPTDAFLRKRGMPTIAKLSDHGLFTLIENFNNNKNKK